MSFDAYTLLIFLAGCLTGVAITLDILAAGEFVRIIQFKLRSHRLRSGAERP